MKPKILIPIVVTLATLGQAFAAPLQPVPLAVHGESNLVLGGGAAPSPIALKLGVPAGATLATGEGGHVALAVAPGQVVLLDGNSQLRVRSLHDAEVGQGAILELLQGSVRCSVDPKQAQQGPVFKMWMKKEVIQARGTLWQSGHAEEGTTRTVVVSSTVGVAIDEANLKIDVAAGSLLISTYDGRGMWTGSKLINLVTGQTTEYPFGGGVTSRPASVTELGQAKGAFQTALAQLTNFVLQEESGILLLTSQINATLTAAGLQPLVLPTGVPASTGRDAIVSPFKP